MAHMQVLLDQYGSSLTKVNLWNYRKSSGLHLAEEVSGWLKANQTIEVFDTVEDCVKDADLIVAATFTSTPVLKGAKAKNCHIMAVGAARPDMAEIDPKVWNDSVVFVDSFSGAKAESGDIRDSKCDIKDELGAFIGKKGKGHKGDKRTAFKSLGLAIQDLVAAKMAFEKFNQNGGEGGKWPVEFMGADKVAEKLKALKLGAEIKENVVAVAKVTNLDTKAILINSEVLVCEMETNSVKLALLYKAKTGELKAIIESQPLEKLTQGQKNHFYIDAFKSVGDSKL